MYVIRGENIIFTSCDQNEKYGHEEIYDTLEEAEKALELFQLSFKDITLFIKKV